MHSTVFMATKHKATCANISNSGREYLKLQESGVKVRISVPRFGRRPLLIIDR